MVSFNENRWIDGLEQAMQDPYQYPDFVMDPNTVFRFHAAGEEADEIQIVDLELHPGMLFVHACDEEVYILTCTSEDFMNDGWALICLQDGLRWNNPTSMTNMASILNSRQFHLVPDDTEVRI